MTLIFILAEFRGGYRRVSLNSDSVSQKIISETQRSISEPLREKKGINRKHGNQSAFPFGNIGFFSISKTFKTLLIYH